MESLARMLEERYRTCDIWSPERSLAGGQKRLASWYHHPSADVAQLVERNLAKVEVAGSIPVVRSNKGGPVAAFHHGDVAEWLGKGLQNPVPGFESRRRLQVRTRGVQGGPQRFATLPSLASNSQDLPVIAWIHEQRALPKSATCIVQRRRPRPRCMAPSRTVSRENLSLVPSLPRRSGADIEVRDRGSSKASNPQRRTKPTRVVPIGVVPHTATSRPTGQPTLPISEVPRNSLRPIHQRVRLKVPVTGDHKHVDLRCCGSRL